MGNPPKPLAVIEATGGKHLTKAEKAERREREEAYRGTSDHLEPPTYLTTSDQRDRFSYIVTLLRAANEILCTDLDVDAVARFVLEEEEYIKATRDLRSYRAKPGKERDVAAVSAFQRNKNAAFKTVTEAARAIGMTVDSRLRFNVPKPKEKPENKFTEGFG